jgi:hypothetical protein
MSCSFSEDKTDGLLEAFFDNRPFNADSVASHHPPLMVKVCQNDDQPTVLGPWRRVRPGKRKAFMSGYSPIIFSAGTIASSKNTRAVPADEEYDVLMILVVTFSERGTSRTVMPF